MPRWSTTTAHLTKTGALLACVLSAVGCAPTDILDLEDDDESEDAGTLGSLLPPSSREAGTSSQSASDAGTSTKSQSTLCYATTSTAAGQNLQLKCTPDGTTSCAALELKPTSYVYTSWSKCSTDARNVLSYWQRTGELGGASPDVTASSRDAGSSRSDAGGATRTGSCPGPGTLTVTVASGCWWIDIRVLESPYQTCGIYTGNYIPNQKMCSFGPTGMWITPGVPFRYSFCPFREGDTSSANCAGRTGVRSGTWSPAKTNDKITFSLVHPEVRACNDGALCATDPLPPGSGLPPITKYD